MYQPKFVSILINIYVNIYGNKPYSLKYLSLNVNTASDSEVQSGIAHLLNPDLEDPGAPTGMPDIELQLLGINTSAFRGNLNKYYRDAQKASLRTIYHYPYAESMENGTSVANSFKHAFFQIEHVLSFGRQLGAALSKAHENNEHRWDSEMDYWNNERGLDIYDANPNSTEQQFDDTVYFFVRNGNMRYLKEGWGSNYLTRTDQ